jgi:5-methylcytosine-specific restriction endonuclease McrA
MSFNSYNKFVYNQYLLSPEWKRLQLQALQRANHKCEKCGSDLNLQCHHKNFKNLYKETLDDLIVLCDQCYGKNTVNFPQKSRHG